MKKKMIQRMLTERKNKKKVNSKIMRIDAKNAFGSNDKSVKNLKLVKL